MGRRLLAALSALALVTFALPAGASADERPRFEPDERQGILSHGPWPMPWTPDTSNRVSGKPAAIALGRQLFFDARLSQVGALSCAFCHQPGKAWGDGRVQASSVARLDRNTAALYNVRHFSWFGWDGASDSLWLQSLRPLTDPRELAATPGHVHGLISGDAVLAARYRWTFGIAAAQEQPETALLNVAKALAAYQETIATGRTPFDAYRDALARHDVRAMRRYPAAAERGLKSFVGRGGCSHCHAGPLFTSQAFYDIGLAPTGGAGAADPGRRGGISRLRDSAYNRLGPHSDDTTGSAAAATRDAISRPGEPGAFKVPSLRNIALTGPYMHNGSKATLADVLRHYAELDEARLPAATRAHLRRLDLTAAEIADLGAFLESLTDAKSLQAISARR